MELLKLSKFKLQLQAIITEARHLKERESSAAEQIHLLVQKQKQTDEEYFRNLQELQAELASSNEHCQKLERKVSYLQNDNALLESKQKEFKETMHRLLQARESFVNAYEESTCDMKRSIETKDRKLTVLSQKINSHLTLFDSIEKEAFSIKQVVDNVECVVSEKEEVVASLKSKLDKISAYEKVFVDSAVSQFLLNIHMIVEGEKICILESKLKNNENEFRRKNKLISELEAELEALKISNNCHTQIEELQKNLSAKDMVIQNLISEKEALHLEVGSLGIVLRRIQDAVASMNQEDKKAFRSVIELKEECDINTTMENNRVEVTVQNGGERSQTEASPPCQENNSVGSELQDNDNFTSCVSESASSRPDSANSEPQSACNLLTISVNDREDNYTVSVHHLSSECSMTQAETSKDPDTEV